jgi:uncharacterized oligopeptide transporter (OPT) family protein
MEALANSSLLLPMGTRATVPNTLVLAQPTGYSLQRQSPPGRRDCLLLLCYRLLSCSFLLVCLHVGTYLLQDFKTAHLLGVSPVDQFWAMLLGSAASVLVSVAAFVLYTSVWEVPGPEFPAPTSQIWLDMAKLVRQTYDQHTCLTSWSRHRKDCTRT